MREPAPTVSLTATERLDRHTFVLTIWATAGLIAASLFHFGLGAGGPVFVLGAFAVVIAGFIGHVILNAVAGCTFTTGEIALGLVLYATGLIALATATLLSPRFAATGLLPTVVGLLAVFVAVIAYMMVQSGVRGAFQAFNVIRSFRPELEEGVGEDAGSSG